MAVAAAQTAGKCQDCDKLPVSLIALKDEGAFTATAYGTFDASALEKPQHIVLIECDIELDQERAPSLPGCLATASLLGRQALALPPFTPSYGHDPLLRRTSAAPSRFWPLTCLESTTLYVRAHTADIQSRRFEAQKHVRNPEKPSFLLVKVDFKVMETCKVVKNCQIRRQKAPGEDLSGYV